MHRLLSNQTFRSISSSNPYSSILTNLNVEQQSFQYYSLTGLTDPRLKKLPYSIRVLLESAIRNCDNFEVKQADVEKILNWVDTSKQDVEIPFKPARVILQDFTGVPAIADLAAMRDAMKRLGGDPYKINPLVPVDLVIDHSVQVDSSRSANSVEQNEKLEFERNYERFEFLKWGQQAFQGLTIVPPGSGIVHQVNLEYLGRVVFHDPKTNLIYPDSLVGTDSHTTMINGLGITGWGVGGIEAEAVMLGQSLSMVLPQVVGFKLTGELQQGTTATDLVLTCVQMLRKRGVVGKFVEFFGPGVQKLSLADRATIANMAPEYGATMGFFPVDDQTMFYLKQTGRDIKKINLIEKYLKAQGLFRNYQEEDPVYSGEIMELDLSSVQPCVSGPKRPHDRVILKSMKQDFSQCLQNPVGFKGFAIPKKDQEKTVQFTFKDGKQYQLKHGSVVIAAITSCTNTSNPDVLIAAGLLAKNATERGLNTLPYIKTSLSPGSGVVQKYLQTSQLLPYLEKIGFYVAGFGCMTCIGNSGEIDEALSEAIQKNDLVAAAVLSGNRNFEGRVHQFTRANYLASPPLVVAYALAGRVDIDFDKEPIGNDKQGRPVFLRDIWPSRSQISQIVNQVIKPEMFQEVYQKISQGTQRWNALKAASGSLYQWKDSSTYIHNPPFFLKTQMEPNPIKNIKDGYCLLNVGDSITTDHISPAGNINKTSSAAKYLQARGVQPKDFNTYGARRGNDEVMARGTFANIRLVNKLASKTGPITLHIPSGQEMSPWEAADKYQKDGQDVIILAGSEYGSGSSRDWAAKGPYLQGVKCVIAKSFERIHRSNLVGMGILPCVFENNQDADSLGLTGKEKFSIDLKGGNIQVGEILTVKTDSGKSFKVKARLDTDVETEYFKNGGILQYVLRKLVKSQ